MTSSSNQGHGANAVERTGSPPSIASVEVSSDEFDIVQLISLFWKIVSSLRSAGDMKNGIGLFCAPIQQFYGFFRWEDDQFHLTTVSLSPNLIHDWQCSGAGTDHQPTAIPRYPLFQRERRVTEI